MPAKESQKNKNQTGLSGLDSAKNLALNSVIFLLIAIIIFLGYSFFMKFSDGSSAAKQNTGKKEVASDIIQMEVRNGCGVTGVADRVTDFMRAKGFDVVDNGNYKSFDVENTIVVDRIGNMANAKKVAAVLGVSNKRVIRQINEEYFLDVSVIIGKDFYSLEPFK